MRIFKIIDYYMLRHWPRYRLFRICKAIGIKPYPWQKWFALGEFDYLPPQLKDERASGKTLAVFLRILMITNNNIHAWARAGKYLAYDPDFEMDRIIWYSKAYRGLRDLCLDAGIPVLRVELYRMIGAHNSFTHR